MWDSGLLNTMGGVEKCRQAWSDYKHERDYRPGVRSMLAGYWALPFLCSAGEVAAVCDMASQYQAVVQSIADEAAATQSAGDPLFITRQMNTFNYFVTGACGC